MGKRVLYLSYDGLTDPLGESQVLSYLRGLAEMGHQFEVISFEKPERAARLGAIQAQIQGLPITWHPQAYTKRPPVLSTLWDVRRMRKLATRLHRENPFDIVHCRSYLSALVGLYLKRHYGVKFLFDMRGFWADERVEGGLWNLRNPVYRRVYNYFKQKEGQFLTEADHTISLTQAGKRVIETELPLPGKPSPVTVIPCCADLAHFNAGAVDLAQQNAWRKNLNIPTETGPVLVYLGSIGTWYALDEMLLFFKQVLVEFQQALLLFITREPTELVRAAAQEVGVPEDRIRVRSAEREELPQVLSLASAGLFFIRPTFSKQASSPTKQGELMGLGLPVICNAGVGDTAAIVEEGTAGLVVEALSPEAITQAALGLSSVLRIPQQNARRVAEKYYSLAVGVATYARVYTTL